MIITLISVMLLGWVLGATHWSQVKEIRKKSREKKNRVKLIKDSQLSDSVSP